MNRRLLFASVLFLSHIPWGVASGIELFSEDFNGVGEFATVDNEFQGMDSPGWRIATSGEFTDDGLHVSGPGTDSDFFRGEKQVVGQGSFLHRVELRDLALPPFSRLAPLESDARVSLFHDLDLERAPNGATGITIRPGFEPQFSEDEYFLRTAFGSISTAVPAGRNVALELGFDATTNTVRYGYDEDILDDEPVQYFDPVPLEGEFVDSTTFPTVLIGEALWGDVSATLTRWSLTALSDVAGDFSGNEILDIADIDLLSAAIGSGDLSFDLTDDQRVDNNDLAFWLHDLKNTYFGDANLDGEFSSADLVNVFAAGQYEDDESLNSAWATGDWNADSDFTSSDLVMAFQDGGYEQGPRATAVPEPTGWALWLVGLVCVGLRRRPAGR